MFAIGGGVASNLVPTVVVNESGINCDFRVESDTEDEAIFLDASDEKLYINKGNSAFSTHMHTVNNETLSVTSAGVIVNEGANSGNDFRVEISQ